MPEQWPEKVTLMRTVALKSPRPWCWWGAETYDDRYETETYVPLSEVREALEGLERFDPENDESRRQHFALGNDPIVMEPYDDGDWLRRSDVLTALPSTDSEGEE